MGLYNHLLIDIIVHFKEIHYRFHSTAPSAFINLEYSISKQIVYFGITTFLENEG